MTPDQAKAIATGTPLKYFNTPLIQWLRFLPSKRKGRSAEVLEVIPPGEPTPDEIKERCAAIREAWPPVIRRQREAEAGVFPAMVPVASTTAFSRLPLPSERD